MSRRIDLSHGVAGGRTGEEGSRWPGRRRWTGPRPALRKYARLQSLFLQEALAYRVEGAIWFLFDILPPFTMVFLWLSAYAGRAEVAGYTLPGIVAYYLVVMTLHTVLTPYPEYDVSRQIRKGTISQHLVRPLSIWLYYLLGELAWKVVRITLLVPVVAIALIALRPLLADLSWSPIQIVAFVGATILSFGLTYLLKMTLAWTAFWFNESYALFDLFSLTSMVFGGFMIPLAMLPEPVRLVSAVLPFQYLYYFPANVLLGRAVGQDLIVGLAAQAAWLFAVVLLSRWLLRRALIHYEAVGG